MLVEGAFVAAMATAAGFDLATRRIPNRLTVGIFAAGLLVRLLSGGLAPLGWGLLGALAGLGLLLLPFAMRWMGGGDVKLAAAIGAWLGPWGVAWAVLFGLAAGGLLALVTLAAGGAALRAEVATNLRNAWLMQRVPEVARRPARKMVPLAVALAAAAVGVLVRAGGWHA
jgi:prepilin peptidase CpaA